MTMETGGSPSSALQELILAVCAGDTDGCKRALQCGASATASVSRQHAAVALGPNAFLGSLSWASQDDFPLLYFGGEKDEGPCGSLLTARAAPLRRPAAWPINMVHTKIHRAVRVRSVFPVFGPNSEVGQCGRRPRARQQRGGRRGEHVARGDCSAHGCAGARGSDSSLRLLADSLTPEAGSWSLARSLMYAGVPGRQ